MDIIVYKTHEITSEQWGKIVYEFNRSFALQKDIKSFKEYYQRTRTGFSYHALAFEDGGNLAGYNSIIPILYRDREGEDILSGISGGTFVVPEFRNDIFIFSDMISSLHEYCSKEGMVVTLGVSNENSFQYALKFLDSTLITYLPYYALPVRLFNVIKKEKLVFLNFLSVVATRTLLWLNMLPARLSNKSEEEVRFEVKTDDEFFRNRFGGGNYHEIKGNNVKAFYKLVKEEGIRTIYLFDFRENEKRTYRALVKAVEYILANEKPDLILFIGHLRLKQFLLLRVPKRFEPQPLPLTFNITYPSYYSYYDAMSAETNWNFGLMNFDAR